MKNTEKSIEKMIKEFYKENEIKLIEVKYFATNKSYQYYNIFLEINSNVSISINIKYNTMFSEFVNLRYIKGELIKFEKLIINLRKLE